MLPFLFKYSETVHYLAQWEGEEDQERDPHKDLPAQDQHLQWLHQPVPAGARFAEGQHQLCPPETKGTAQ